MKSLRSRLLISHVIPLMVLIPLLVIIIVSVLQSQDLLVKLSDQLTNQAEVLAVLVEDHPEVWSNSIEAQSFVEDFSRSMQIHISLIQPGGNLLASSDPNSTPEPTEFTQIQELIRIEEDESSTRIERVVIRSSASDNTVVLPVLDTNQQLIGVLQVHDQLGGVYERFGVLQPLMLALMIGGLIIAATLGLVLALRLEHNLHDVTTAIVQVANGQELTPVAESGPDEIREVIQAFNTLVVRLNDSQESRKHLLSNLVHELGQPLGAMGSAVRALSSGAYQDDDLRQQLLNGLDTHIQSMQPLLENLVQLHQQIIGLPQIQLQEVQLHQWLPPIIQMWQSSATEKELQVNLTVASNIPAIKIDPQQMTQVINNLMSNAIKYTPDGGTIHVSGVEHQTNGKIASADKVEIRVRDNGIGIDPAMHELVFSKFYQTGEVALHSSAKTKFKGGGPGLGLAITRGIVEAHRGKIWLESPGYDENSCPGTTFYVLLPLVNQTAVAI